MKRIWILLLIFLLPFSAAAGRQVTLTFVGDCTIGGEDRLREEDFSFDAYLEKYGYDYFFREVQSVIAIIPAAGWKKTTISADPGIM